MTRTLEDLKGDRDALIELCRSTGKQIKNHRSFACVFCDDKKPSADLYKKGSHWNYKCHKCGFQGSIVDVHAKLNHCDPSDSIKKLCPDGNPRMTAPTNTTPEEKVTVYPTYDRALSVSAKLWGGEVVRVYKDYREREDGEIRFVAGRLEKVQNGKREKTFRQFKRCDEGWVKGRPEKIPLFRTWKVLEAKAVVFVEGEKDVETLDRFGIVATTSAMGAGKSEHTDLTPLAGKTVYLWPDKDEAGSEHMSDVAETLIQLNPPARVKRIDPYEFPEWQPKWDVTDVCEYFDQHLGQTEEAIGAMLKEIIKGAVSIGPAGDLSNFLGRVMSGEIVNLPFSHPILTSHTQALIPASITIICGAPGATKSFFVGQEALFWHKEGIPIALYYLENDRNFHLNRALAQITGNSSLTDYEWIKSNPEKVLQALELHEEKLDSFGSVITQTITRSRDTLPKIAFWAEERAKAGAKIIIIDPISLASKGDSRVREDEEFMGHMDFIAKEHGVRMILVTHPKDGLSGTPNLQSLMGGKVYERAASTVLWLEPLAQPVEESDKMRRVKFNSGYAEREVNRIIHLLKTRSGKGQGVQIGYQWYYEHVCFFEQGILAPEKKKGRRSG